MISSWQTPLPLEEQKKYRVVIYLYNDQWIPIIFSPLAEAITIHRYLLQHGKEIFVFLPHLNPREYSISANNSSRQSLKGKESLSKNNVPKIPKRTMQKSMSVRHKHN